ncbi:dihydrofolate reductase [Caulobacter sp. S45]|uniref:dihydrofolate reductase n=1 Tax=Caulobacter sp. S45 TaxID=1641861 RepID=UPI00131DEFF5|nr:dihydrofolate reductase [Caulobacter sp. S45]
MSQPILCLVAARARNGVIGRDGVLPWRLKSDMAHFKAVTLGKPVIMGRKTWDSLPKRPLPGRANFVLSRDGTFEPWGAVVCERLEDAVSMAREQAEDDGVGEVCVIGGTSLYALALPKAKRLYLTEVQTEAEGDAVFPSFDEGSWAEVSRETHDAGDGDEHPFVFRVLERASLG